MKKKNVFANCYLEIKWLISRKETNKKFHMPILIFEVTMESGHLYCLKKKGLANL